MKVVFILAVLFFGQCQAVADFTQTQELLQGPPGYYFFQAYAGTHLEPRRLLLDTQANGTAVEYDPTKSYASTRHNEMTGTVTMPSS